jgi:hypothetical protein
MQIIGVDLHARPQTISMLNTTTGEIVKKILARAGQAAQQFYSALKGTVVYSHPRSSDLVDNHN